MSWKNSWFQLVALVAVISGGLITYDRFFTFTPVFSPLLTIALLALFWTAIVVLLVIYYARHRGNSTHASDNGVGGKQKPSNSVIKITGAIVVTILCIYFHFPIAWALGICILLAGIVAFIAKPRILPVKALLSNKVDPAKLATTNFVQYSPWLKGNVRGHDGEIDEIAYSIQEELSVAKSGKIIGAYLLVGPTGTGKTFLSQLCAQALYPESEPIILRMNQLKHPDDVFTLIGPPPGRAGYEVGGSLTRPVLENPYRVVIFDEIEKCHPDLHHCLYDILDMGQCREKSSNKVVDFSGCVFFGTCNAGVEQLRSVYSRTDDFNKRATESRDALNEAAKFDKAFLARWTRIILMDELAPVHVAEVALLQVCHYWKDYGMEVSFVPPELLLEAVERNEEFRSYGVRQLSTFIRRRTNQAINQARTAKLTRVLLNVSPDGDIVVKPMK